jgi:hypothetical protein
MNPSDHIRGPYQEGTAGDDAYQLACHGCTIADLITLANQKGVAIEYVLEALRKGARRSGQIRGKDASTRMGGDTWDWELSLDGGPPITDVSLSPKNTQMRVKIVNPRH